MPKSSKTVKPPKSSHSASEQRPATPRGKRIRTDEPAPSVPPEATAPPESIGATSSTVEASAGPNEATVPLGSDLRIGRARDLYTALVEGAAPGAVVIIDGTEVAKVDAAGLQCVVAAAVRLRTAGATWRWHNPSPALKSAAQLLGLDGVLELT